MPFVTRVTLKSGDSDRLTECVADIKERAERKGAALKGPHARPPERYSVPQYKGMPSQGSFDPWGYTVYTRIVEIVDHNDFAREVTQREYPDSIHITANVETM